MATLTTSPVNVSGVGGDGDGSGVTDALTTAPAGLNLTYLPVLLFIVAGIVGNVLVCLAICLEKALQSVTNYFLLSLAVADLLVSCIVMPFGLVAGLLSEYRDQETEWEWGRYRYPFLLLSKSGNMSYSAIVRELRHRAISR